MATYYFIQEIIRHLLLKYLCRNEKYDNTKYDLIIYFLLVVYEKKL